MSNDRKNVVKRASYRLSFKTVRNTDGSYTVSAIRMDDKGNQSPIDKKDNTLNIFLGSIFGKAIEDTLTSFINDDDGRVNETVKAMFDIAGIGIDRPDKAHNHDLDWVQHCDTPEAKAEAISNLDAFTDCLPDVLRQVSTCRILTYDSNETREAELVAPIYILERTRQRDLMEDLILAARDRVHSMANGVDRRRYARWFMSHLIGGSLFFISCRHDNSDRFDDGAGNPLCAPDSALMADFMIGAMDTPDWYGDLVLIVLLLNITNASSDSIEDLLDPDNVLTFDRIEQHSRFNIGFALYTRPESMDLRTALSILPNRKTGMEEWIRKRRATDYGLVFETWEALTHDWDGPTMFNIVMAKPHTWTKYHTTSVTYSHAAAMMSEDRNVDPDKVVELFESYVPKPIHGNPAITQFRNRNKHNAQAKYSLWHLMNTIDNLSIRTRDIGYMEAFAWLVNLYANLLDHSEVSNWGVYKCPLLTSDMLPKAVAYYNDGLPFSFIIENLLALIAARNDDELHFYVNVSIDNKNDDESIFPRHSTKWDDDEAYIISSNNYQFR